MATSRFDHLVEKPADILEESEEPPANDTDEDISCDVNEQQETADEDSFSSEFKTLERLSKYWIAQNAVKKYKAVKQTVPRAASVVEFGVWTATLPYAVTLRFIARKTPTPGIKPYLIQ